MNLSLLAGLASLVALSLFLAYVLRRSSALMPLVAVAVSMLFFTLAGCLDFLRVGGYVWYAGCFVALVFTIALAKRRFWALFSPGLVFFLLASLGFILLFTLTKPMLVHWDEFTFWGTAAKVTSTTNELYVTAQSNLIARSYPPGLIVYNYMMQFFGHFTEGGMLAAYGILYMACFAAAAALWGKNRPATVVCLAAMVLLPLLFENNSPPGQMLWAYRTVMADAPMAALFGGAICLYYAGGEKGGRLMVPLGLVLAALVCVKDMGLALALVALGVIGVDMWFCERDRMAFFGLRRWKAALVSFAYCLVVVVGIYLAWGWKLKTAIDVNRFDIGSGGASLSAFSMLGQGVAMLFGFGRSEQFSEVLSKMARAFFTEPVSLIGSGAVMLCVIAAVLVLCFVLSATRRQRQRVLLFALSTLLGFIAFYVFNIFTYAFVFDMAEASMLREYRRYISPYWMGWLMGALTLLTRAATNPRATFYRLRVARATSGVVSLVLVAAVLLRGNWNGNFMNVSPSFYTERLRLQGVVAEARQQGMGPNDKVYIVSQSDNGSRYYLYGYEMADIPMALLYSGPKLDENGQPLLDEAGKEMMQGNVATTFVSFEQEELGPYQARTTPTEWLAWLRMQGCTHILLDRIDEYFEGTFAELFTDDLEGWAGGDMTVHGARYYEIAEIDGEVRFVPAKGGAA